MTLTVRPFLQSELFPLKFSISSQPGWQAGTIKVTLVEVTMNTAQYGYELAVSGRQHLSFKSSTKLEPQNIDINLA